MALTYTRFLGALAPAPTGVWTELFRAPSSGTVVVRDVLITNAGTAPLVEAAIRDRALAKAGDRWWWYAKALPLGTVHYELRQVVQPGRALEVYTEDGTLYVTVSGYVFDS